MLFIYELALFVHLTNIIPLCLLAWLQNIWGQATTRTSFCSSSATGRTRRRAAGRQCPGRSSRISYQTLAQCWAAAAGPPCRPAAPSSSRTISWGRTWWGCPAGCRCTRGVARGCWSGGGWPPQGVSPALASGSGGPSGPPRWAAGLQQQKGKTLTERPADREDLGGEETNTNIILLLRRGQRRVYSNSPRFYSFLVRQLG